MKTEIKKILYKFLQDGISSDDAVQQVLDLFGVSCCCGLTIPDSEIDYKNGCNEEGEDYFIVIADCTCGKDYEVSGWGELDSITEAKEELKEYIKSNYS